MFQSRSNCSRAVKIPRKHFFHEKNKMCTYIISPPIPSTGYFKGTRGSGGGVAAPRSPLCPVFWGFCGDGACCSKRRTLALVCCCSCTLLSISIAVQGGAPPGQVPTLLAVSRNHPWDTHGPHMGRTWALY
ncbi:unnamed protein product, partial [Ectocarpus sp. 13 AM-2016]